MISVHLNTWQVLTDSGASLIPLVGGAPAASVSRDTLSHFRAPPHGRVSTHSLRLAL